MIRHPISFIFILLLCSISGNALLAQPAHKHADGVNREDAVWTGDVSDQWDNPLNWSTSGVPDQNSNVIIPDDPAGARFPVIPAPLSAACLDLTISPGSSLSIRGFLTVYGQLVNTDATALVILSDATGTGSLIFNSSNVAATVQRYLSDGVNHFIGAPLNGARVEDLFFNNDPVVYLYRYSEATGSWLTISDPDDPLVPGLGYSVYVSVTKTKQPVTANFSGTLNDSDLTLSGNLLTYTSESPYPGYNLVSNPFSSALSWDLGNWQAENVSGSVWLWNGSYNYLYRNAHGMGSLSGGVIPSAQAFFVRAIADNPVLTLSAEDRVHSNQNFYKSAGRENEVYFAIEVRMGDKEDEVWVAFCGDCTEGEDTGWDTEKLYGIDSAPQLYLTSEDRELSINALPYFGNQTVTLPLYFEAGEPGQHSITLTELEAGDLEGIGVLLKDLVENEQQFLSMNPTYSFIADTTDPADRFELDIWETPLGVEDGVVKDEFLIYAFNKTVKIKPVKGTSGQDVTVRIYDISGRLRNEVNDRSDHEIKILLQTDHSYVIVQLITDDAVLHKQLYIE